LKVTAAIAASASGGEFPEITTSQFQKPWDIQFF
jgi:hypothetical protein